MKEELLNEYKETKDCLEMGMDCLQQKDYAQGKLDLVNTIIEDLKKLAN